MKKIFFIIFLMMFVFLTGLNAVEINISGASFPYPLYKRLINDYKKVNEDINIKYLPNGSLAGFTDFKNNQVHLAGIDLYINEQVKDQLPNKIVHIPTCLSGIVLSYNLKDNPKLKLTSDIISKIYRGDIQYWDDSAIKALNPGLYLPSMRIVPIYRADKSGSTFILTEMEVR